jgi:hypothetical protein
MTDLKTFAPQDLQKNKPGSNISSRITSYLRMIERVLADGEITALLNKVGYDGSELGQGQMLCQHAQASFDACQKALLAQSQAEAAFKRAYQSARTAFMRYRSASQPVVKTAMLRYELALEGKLPSDAFKFAAIANSGYKVAFNTPVFLSSLQQSGVPVSYLEDGCSSLESFFHADDAHEKAKAITIDATIECDLAMQRLENWIKYFCQDVKTVLRDRPLLAQEILEI